MATVEVPKTKQTPTGDPHYPATGERVKAAVRELHQEGGIDNRGRRIRRDARGGKCVGQNTGNTVMKVRRVLWVSLQAAGDSPGNRKPSSVKWRSKAKAIQLRACRIMEKLEQSTKLSLRRAAANSAAMARAWLASSIH